MQVMFSFDPTKTSLIFAFSVNDLSFENNVDGLDRGELFLLFPQADYILDRIAITMSTGQVEKIWM